MLYLGQVSVISIIKVFSQKDLSRREGMEGLATRRCTGRRNNARPFLTKVLSKSSIRNDLNG